MNWDKVISILPLPFFYLILFQKKLPIYLQAGMHGNIFWDFFWATWNTFPIFVNPVNFTDCIWYSIKKTVDSKYNFIVSSSFAIIEQCNMF